MFNIMNNIIFPINNIFFILYIRINNNIIYIIYIKKKIMNAACIAHKNEWVWYCNRHVTCLCEAQNSS